VSTPQYPTDPQWQGGQDPNYPTQPGYPPQQGYPPQPSYPQQPNYPQPAYPSQPLYPQYGEQPPAYPGQPAYPTQPGFGYGGPPSQYPGQPPYGGPPQPPKPNRVPLIIGIVAAVVLLCVVLPGAFIAISALRGVSNIGQAVRDADATQTAASATLAAATATVAAGGEETIYENPMDGSRIDWRNKAECQFKPDGYHITAAFICFAPQNDVGDIDVTVTTKQITGATNKFYGIALRGASTVASYYAFEIDANGKWAFEVAKSGTSTALVDVSANAAIRPGLGATNTLRVRAVGSHFIFFVNGTQVGTADDPSFNSGLLGLFGDDGADVAFTNFKLVQPAA
jgi:hypothetical protein